MMGHLADVWFVVKCSWNPASDWCHYPYGALLEITGELLIYIWSKIWICRITHTYIYMYIIL